MNLEIFQLDKCYWYPRQISALNEAEKRSWPLWSVELHGGKRKYLVAPYDVENETLIQLSEEILEEENTRLKFVITAEDFQNTLTSMRLSAMVLTNYVLTWNMAKILMMIFEDDVVETLYLVNTYNFERGFVTATN